jgi:folylpolyglutamate synthase/dihydropteroate synthase
MVFVADDTDKNDEIKCDKHIYAMSCVRDAVDKTVEVTHAESNEDTQVHVFVTGSLHLVGAVLTVLESSEAHFDGHN